MNILALETSCDETSVAIVQDGVKVLSHIIETSVDEHKKTGGIVPEVAARDAAGKILRAVKRCFSEIQNSKFNIQNSIDAIAVTTGPGLIGSLLVGIETARTLAYIHKKPLIPIHHITGHICANRLEEKKAPTFPIMVLTVSGGHNDLVFWKSEFEFEKVGFTIDDASGEAFDKGARLLGLGFPGGPEISKYAETGDSTAYKFPRPMVGSGDFRFSFSGLKTALLYKIQDLKKHEENLETRNSKIKNENFYRHPKRAEKDKKEEEKFQNRRNVGEIDDCPNKKNEKENLNSHVSIVNSSQKSQNTNIIQNNLSNLAASYQEAICETLSKKLQKAAEKYNVKEIHLTGGVSANKRLRKIISSWTEKKGIEFRYPKKISYCTDNAAMIGGAAFWKYKKFPKEKWGWKNVEATLKRDFF